MRPGFLGRLGPADVFTVVTAMIGFGAVVATTVDARLAARLILLAAITDGVDGFVARRFGGSAVGKYLDSLADVASFGVGPAILVFTVARDGWDVPVQVLSPRLVVIVVIPALFLGMVVVRLGFYIADQSNEFLTRGVPGTLAATILAAAILTVPIHTTVLVAATAVLAYLMVTRIGYPDLLDRDAFLMGAVTGLAALFPGVFQGVFPVVLLVLSLAYLLLAPRFYWRSGE